MKTDLLDAADSVRWIISKLPAFEHELVMWCKINFDVVVRELPNNTPNDIVVAIEKEPLPSRFSIEAGAYINTLRSSLDMVAVAVGKRHKVLFPDDIYFPVANSATDFLSGNYKGSKFVKGLPRADRELIETFRPYKGGNNLLFALHQMDIVRKHRRLLRARIDPVTVTIRVRGAGRKFIPVSTGLMRTAYDETVLGLITKGAEKPQLKFAGHVIVDETFLAVPHPVIGALYEFADLANTIIMAFDN